MLLGRLHPVLVHFPIALLIVAVGFEFCSMPFRAERKTPWSTALACAVLGAVGALAAVWSGWTNADVESHGSAAQSLITTHRWLGVAAGSLALVAAGSGTLGAVLGSRRCTVLYRAALALAAVLVGVAGHWGGTLIYGEGYLTAALRASPVAPPPEPADAVGPTSPGTPSADVAPEAEAAAEETAPADLAGMFAVAQILEDHCLRCHGPQRQRGRLRLDDLGSEGLRPPERDVISPGDPAGSVLLARVKLPRDHEDAMPPAEEGPGLSAPEIAAIEAWILGGAHAGVAARATPGALAEPNATPPPALALPSPPPLSATPAMDAALAALRERGVVATRLSAADPWIEVRFDLLGPAIHDADLALLEPLAPALVTLNISGTAITDAGLERVGSLPNLRALDAARTNITDEGIAHLRELAKLERLNLHESPITDEAVGTLAALSSLRQVFLWRTKVSEQGVEQLRQHRPELQIDVGQPPPQSPPP